DGTPDLAVAATTGKVSILLGRGDGTFQDAVSVSAGTTCNCVALGDFNGDGKLDLAIADPSAPAVRILLGHGDGTFRDASPAAAMTGVVQVLTGDFNGDGQL